MKIRLRRVGWLPNRIEALWLRTFATEEVRAPRLRGIEVRAQRTHWNRKVGDPFAVRFIQLDQCSHPAGDVPAALRRDIEVEPLPIRADLELLVMLFTEAVRLEKDLGDVAVP